MNAFDLSVLQSASLLGPNDSSLPRWLLPVYGELRRGRRVLLELPFASDNALRALQQQLQLHGVSSQLWNPSSSSLFSLTSSLQEALAQNSVLLSSLERSSAFWAEVKEDYKAEVEWFSLSQEGQMTELDATVGKGPIWLREPTHTKLSVGLLGLGTVGGGVVQWLQSFPHRFDISGIAVRSLDKERPSWIPRHALTNDPWEVLERQPDLVIEVMGGLEPSFALLKSALEQGISVVSANKDLLSLQGEVLQEAAAHSGALLLHSAAVGGSVPMLEITESLVDSEEILQVEGILNGTTNFVLGRMEEGLSSEEAVHLAQEAGFAEADPSSDLQGLDAAYKVSLLAEAAFGTSLSVELIECEGIEDISLEQVQAALEAGECYRLVASCCRRGSWLEASVRPVRVPLEHPFARVRDEYNLVQWGLSNNRCFFSYGKGAGRWPTALAVMGDIVEFWEEKRAVSRLERRGQRPRKRCA